MSHITTIDLMITDLDSLSKACERLGLELVLCQRTHKWYGRFVGDSRGITDVAVKDYGKCEHAIRVKGSATAYEVGLIKRTDGKAGYRLAWDYFRGGYGLVEKLSYMTATEARGANVANADKLKDWYAAEVAKKQMRRQGFRVTATQQQGRVQVLCSK